MAPFPKTTIKFLKKTHKPGIINTFLHPQYLIAETGRSQEKPHANETQEKQSKETKPANNK